MKKLLISKILEKCSNILDIETPEVLIYPFDNDGISAMFISSPYCTVQNGLWLVQTNPIEIFITICHEMRHAYQFYRVNNDKVTNDNKGLIQKWKEEFDNYCYPQDERFLEQEIEIDAIAFAHFMTLKYLGERTVIPDNIKKKVYLRIQQITETLEG